MSVSYLGRMQANLVDHRLKVSFHQHLSKNAPTSRNYVLIVFQLHHLSILVDFRVKSEHSQTS